MITIVALGPGNPGLMTLGALEALRAADTVILRTERHGCVGMLAERGIRWRTLDKLYEAAHDFDELGDSIAREVVSAARESDVAYAVSDLSDATVNAIAAAAGAETPALEVEYIPGVPMQAFAAAGLGGQWCVADAADWAGLDINPRHTLIIRELNSELLASELKVRLMERYPEETKVLFYAPSEHESRTPIEMRLSELDRQPKYDHTALCRIAPVELTKLDRFDFYHLMEVIRLLRAPGGCPWDREQTHESLKRALIEECYEVLEAIDADDMNSLYDELGDLLLQVVFHSCIAEEHADFMIDDVTSAICNKMISRHTHIFGDAEAATAQDVLRNWEAIKLKEKGLKSHTAAMRDVGRNLPALLRADKVQNKARQVGFDFKTAAEAMPKVREEIEEVQAELDAGSDKLAGELGDLLFATVNVIRLAELDPEQALTSTTDKFIKRFELVEKLVGEAGASMAGMALEELDKYWDKAKAVLRAQSNCDKNV